MENVLFVEDLIHELQKVLDEYGNIPVAVRMGEDPIHHGMASSVSVMSGLQMAEIIPV